MNLPNLSGLWRYTWDTQDKWDDKFAIAIGHVHEDGKTAGPHGTFTRVRYFRIYMAKFDEVENGRLDIFNDEGGFGRFISDGGGSWRADSGGVEFIARAGGMFVTKDQSFWLYNNLLIDAYTAENCPSNANAGTRYIAKISGLDAHEAAILAQKITYDPINDTFKWFSGNPNDSEGLLFERVYEQPSEKSPSGPDNFGDTFKGQNKMGQIAFPFYGFNPSKMLLYKKPDNDEPPLTSPGTPFAATVATNPRQTFNGTLIFQFPREDSKDYARAIDIPDTPFLPLGLWGKYWGFKNETAHTQILSSIHERMDSYLVTLGLSSALSKLASLKVTTSMGTRISEQSKQECRYAVSRKTSRDWTLFADMPSHRLHQDFIRWVQSTTVGLLTHPGRVAKEPNWENFVTKFGTHYAHAITQGSIKFTETRFSLKAEKQAAKQTKTLKVLASEVIEKVNLSSQADYSKEWSQTHHVEVSSQDVTEYSFGEHNPMGILFDLRPIYELLSPQFFPYNPADDFGKVAPLVWTDVRESLSAYLTKLGADKPVGLGLDFNESYAPRIFEVYFESISIVVPVGNHRDSSVKWKGSINAQVLQDNEVEAFPISVGDFRSELNYHADKPSLVMLFGAGDTPIKFKVAVDIEITAGIYKLGYGGGGIGHHNLKFKNEQTVDFAPAGVVSFRDSGTWLGEKRESEIRISWRVKERSAG